MTEAEKFKAPSEQAEIGFFTERLTTEHILGVRFFFSFVKLKSVKRCNVDVYY